jgi:hypothetical protein
MRGPNLRAWCEKTKQTKPAEAENKTNKNKKHAKAKTKRQPPIGAI